MSRQHLSTYINFQGRAREAMEFYQKALGGKVELQTTDERGTSRPAGPADRITHARLEGDGVRIVGTDGHPNYPAKVGENVALALSGTDRGQLTKSFNHLAEGGIVKVPLSEQGFLLDKFGINWVVSVDKT